jgi:hypothetical protein
MPRKQQRDSTPGPKRLAGKPAAKPVPLGTDLALSLPTGRDQPLPVTYWDLWFALVAVRDCGSDLARLGERLGESSGGMHVSLENAARKRSHLRDLEKRLAAAGVSVDDIVNAAGTLAGTELRRARGRVLEGNERQHERSESMRRTLKQRGEHDALRGSWPRFPVSPSPHADEIGSLFQTRGFYTEGQSFGVVRKLERFLERAEKLINRGRHAEAQALLRAWLTVVIELMHIADDSYGCIGDSFHQGFAAYLRLTPEQTGIEEAVFLEDLLELLIWEDYGLTDDQTEGYWERLTQSQGDRCVQYLRRRVAELRADYLPYQSEEALTLLGQVAVEQDRFEMFEDLAREMGTRAWRRIVRLADRAVKKRKRPLAVQVFEAALTPGPHLGFLTKKYEQLKAGKWNPDPRK